MEHLWKTAIQLTSDRILEIEAPEVDQILVDLCTGAKHKVISVTKTVGRSVLQTLPAGECKGEELARIRIELGYNAEGCTPFVDIRYLKAPQ